jgi:hypothetical protein
LIWRGRGGRRGVSDKYRDSEESRFYVPFIRLSDNYIDHPKFLALSDRAFRLWHEGMAFCRKHQTDGLIPLATLQGFRYYRAGAVIELATPYHPDVTALWESIKGVGYQVHKYLYWNLSKEEEQQERDAATSRMRKFRKSRRDAKSDAVGDGVTNGVRDRGGSAFVQDRIGTSSLQESKDFKTEKESEEKPKIDARSKRPIFSGQRLTVFEWQLDDCAKTLGEYTDAFDLHTWFYAIDAMAVNAGLVLPKRDGGAWLQGQLVAEAQRRGVPLRLATVPQAGKLTTRLSAALANIEQEAADGIKRLR